MTDLRKNPVRYRGIESHFFSNNEEDLISRHHINGKFYEIEELEYMKMLIPRRSHVLDIGANIGNHSVFFSTHCRADRVTPFEANKAAYDLLAMNCDANRKETFDTSHLGLAVSNKSEKLKLGNVQKNNLGSQTLTADSDGKGDYIDAITIDSLNLERADFVKIDVEGMEVSVLEGLSNTVRRLRPIIFCEVQRTHQPAFFAWCRDHNYRIERTFQRYLSVFNFSIFPNW